MRWCGDTLGKLAELLVLRWFGQANELLRRGLGPGSGLALSFRMTSVSNASIRTAWTPVLWTESELAGNDTGNASVSGSGYGSARGLAAQLEALLPQRSIAGVYQLQVRRRFQRWTNVLSIWVVCDRVTVRLCGCVTG